MSASRRRRAPWWILALLFVVVQIFEIYLLIQLGQVVGPWWTILILIADGILGSWLVKREGGRAWKGLQEALAAHRMPANELADGALILVGGTLLITPGFISDVVGLFCVVPLTRPVARRVLARVISRRLQVATAAASTRGQSGPASFGFGVPPGFRPPGASSGSGARSAPGAPGAPNAPGQTARRPGHGEVIQGEVVDPD